MSHRPPNGHAHGPPPPYYRHPAPPPPPGSFAYVPTPVVLPPYPHYPPTSGPPQENATYITNYYVQPPQPSPSLPAVPVAEPLPVHPPVETVRVSDNSIDWVPATALTVSSFSARAVVAGHEGWDGSPLWVIRAHYSGDLIPGKLAVKHRIAYIPYCGKEIPITSFEVLCAAPNTTRWIQASNGMVPLRAIPGGRTVKGETLYICRAKHQFSKTPGKVHPSHGCCYISFGGKEIAYKFYEVLCQI